MGNVEETIFEKPSGNVRGLVNAFIELGGKKKRIAHATLLADRGPDIGLEIPRKIAVADIPAVASVLTEFAARVQVLAA